MDNPSGKDLSTVVPSPGFDSGELYEQILTFKTIGLNIEEKKKNLYYPSSTSSCNLVAGFLALNSTTLSPPNGAQIKSNANAADTSH